MKKISLLIPVYNEEASLDALYAALRPLLDNEHQGLKGAEYEWEAILVDAIGKIYTESKHRPPYIVSEESLPQFSYTTQSNTNTRQS